MSSQSSKESPKECGQTKSPETSQTFLRDNTDQVSTPNYAQLQLSFAGSDNLHCTPCTPSPPCSLSSAAAWGRHSAWVSHRLRRLRLSQTPNNLKNLRQPKERTRLKRLPSPVSRMQDEQKLATKRLPIPVSRMQDERKLATKEHVTSAALNSIVKSD